MSNDKEIAKITETMESALQIDDFVKTRANDKELLKIAETAGDALLNGDFEKVKTILEGLKPEDRETLLKFKMGHKQQTLFMFSCLDSSVRTAEMILDYAQQYESDIVNATNIFLVSPLHFGVSYNNTKLVARLLSVPGIDVNVQTLDGFTPLMWAARKGDNEAVSMLIKHPSIRTDLKSNFDQTAMEIALDHEQHGIIALLVSFAASKFE